MTTASSTPPQGFQSHHPSHHHHPSHLRHPLPPPPHHRPRSSNLSLSNCRSRPTLQGLSDSPSPDPRYDHHHINTTLLPSDIVEPPVDFTMAQHPSPLTLLETLTGASQSMVLPSTSASTSSSTLPWTLPSKVHMGDEQDRESRSTTPNFITTAPAPVSALGQDRGHNCRDHQEWPSRGNSQESNTAVTIAAGIDLYPGTGVGVGSETRAGLQPRQPPAQPRHDSMPPGQGQGQEQGGHGKALFLARTSRERDNVSIRTPPHDDIEMTAPMDTEPDRGIMPHHEMRPAPQDHPDYDRPRDKDDYDSSPARDPSSHRGSMAIDQPQPHHHHHHLNQHLQHQQHHPHPSTLSPSPSPSRAPDLQPQSHPSGYDHDDHHHPAPRHYQTYTPPNAQSPNGGSFASDPHPGYGHHQRHPSQPQHTPSPPLPSASSEGFQGRPLPPIEPSHPLHGYMSNSRRGSVVAPDPAFHPDHRRPSSSSTVDPSNYYNTNGPSTSPARDREPTGPPASTSSLPDMPHHRHYGNSSPASTTSPSSEAYHSHTPNSPLQLRHSDYNASVRRESLPSIHSSAGPLGQLLAQEPQRRHSIAHSDMPVGGGGGSGGGAPSSNGSGGLLKRKTSGTPLSQVYNSDSFDHPPAKRRDSIPDIALSLHNHHPHLHGHGLPHGSGGSGGYSSSRSSYSAPSSPPRRGSIALTHGNGTVPTVNLQPPAEIKTSGSMDHLHHPHPSSGNSGPANPIVAGSGNSGANGTSSPSSGRPHYPPLHHQPRRSSLLSESGPGSRRSSVVDSHHSHHGSHPYHHPAYMSSSSSSSQGQPQQQQDYDHRMNVEMERMHLSGGHESSSSAGPKAGPSQSQPGSHLYPGYPYGGSEATSGSGQGLVPNSKGETPYSRSPELRVSHKLAERKRRKEMKDLFDELRDSLPVDRSLKTSKWEILSKAVDYIATIKTTQDELTQEVEMLREQVAKLKE